MTTKTDILQRLRQNTREKYERPDLSFPKTVYPDPVAQFITTTTTTAGASLIEARQGENLADIVARIAKDYKRADGHKPVVATNMAGIAADLNPDTVETAQQLDGTDIGVVLGTVGVAENGCVWVPQTMKERAVCFIAEHLVIVVNRSAIVSNMHEAYSRIAIPEDAPCQFGTFISGPSKTADIEQSLVYGAQAARAVTVIVSSEHLFK